MLGIVVSRADSASTAIFDQLRSLADWERSEDDRVADARGGGAVYRLPGSEPVVVRTFDDLHIDLRDVTDPFGDLDLLVFASRHAGDTGDLLTAHFTGNFGPAEYGGDERSFARTCPNAQRAVVEALSRHAPDAYGVGVECTHHGPTDVDVPSMFVELGSDEQAWNDPEGARAVARSILDIRGVVPDVRSVAAGTSSTGGDHADDRRTTDGTSADEDSHTGDATSNRHVVGFGGGHYAPRFERVIRETDWGVGHIGSDWQLDELGDPTTEEGHRTLRRVFEASATDLAVVEGTKPTLVDELTDLGYRVVSESFLRATTGVPRDRVAALEALLCRVEDGLRFGDPARGSVDGAVEADALVDDLDVRSLPVDLLETAQGVDAEATRAATERHAVAFETTESGTRVAGRAAFPVDGYDRFVDDLTTVLEGKYDEVRRADGVVHATVTTFDPEAAATLGVPEGPAFGKLAAGQPVEVDGRTIDPSVVQSTRHEEFSL